jgi:co-chaperonin GroES (HSP10)
MQGESKMTYINPLGKLLLVKEIEVTESKTASGLVLTATSTEQDLKKGIVIKVGPGERSNFNGELYPVDTIKEGMVVYYSPNHATEITDSVGEKLFFVNSGVLFGYEDLEDLNA